MPIFEDDCYADLIWDGKRPPAIHAMDNTGSVIHIGSFSKSIAPALRVGYIVAPWVVLSRMLALKTDAGSGALEQMVLAEYCAPHFASHVPKLNRGLRAKLETLMEALNEQFGTSAEFEDPKGGIFLWVKLPDNVDTLKLYQAALAAGVAINPGPGMVDRQGLCRQPAAAVLCQPLARTDPRGRRGARRCLPQGIRRTGAKRQCGEAGSNDELSWLIEVAPGSGSAVLLTGLPHGRGPFAASPRHCADCRRRRGLEHGAVLHSTAVTAIPGPSCSGEGCSVAPPLLPFCC